MNEKTAIKYILFAGVVSAVIMALSIASISKDSSEIISSVALQVACMRENNTYFLAYPTSDEFCDNIPLDGDLSDLREICVRMSDSAKRESCLGLAGLVEKRIIDCNNYLQTNGLPTTSVTNREVTDLCVPIGY